MLGKGLKNKILLLTRHSMIHPDDLFVINPTKSGMTQITDVNKDILARLAKPTIQMRWVKTTDGKKELVWIILPPHFDANKKYPTLLYCEGDRRALFHSSGAIAGTSTSWQPTVTSSWLLTAADSWLRLSVE